jgi:hypothetical protein
MVIAEKGEFDFCSCNNFFNEMNPNNSNEFIQNECSTACVDGIVLEIMD